MKQARTKQPTSVLGLAFDGSRLEGVEVRRTNGSVEVRKHFSVSLALDPLTGDTELVGREIRNHLNAAGIKEKHCAVCLPLGWALTLSAQLPDLGEEDVESFLQIEAERGFPYGLDALSLGRSRFRTPTGQHATLVAIPLEHVTRLDAALHAAQLRPLNLSLGLPSIQRPESESSDGVLALWPGEDHVQVMVTCGGGIVVLRTIEHAYEVEGGERRLLADQIARELRITLGQLPAELSGAVQNLRVIGKNPLADDLAGQLRTRVQTLGLKVEQVRECTPGAFTVNVPSGTAMTPALALAVRLLTGQVGMNFLPPKVSQWKVLAAKYSTGKLVWAGAAAGAVVTAVLLAFAVQEVMLRYWSLRVTRIKPQADRIAEMERQIQKYRPWYDESFPALTILSRATDAFTKTGDVTAKTVSIQHATPAMLRSSQPHDPVNITFTGVARNNAALFGVLNNLKLPARGFKNVKLESITGKEPQLRFSIKLGYGGQPAATPAAGSTAKKAS
jgi:hypothetical protein